MQWEDKALHFSRCLFTSSRLLSSRVFKNVVVITLKADEDVEEVVIIEHH